MATAPRSHHLHDEHIIPLPTQIIPQADSPQPEANQNMSVKLTNVSILTASACLVGFALAGCSDDASSTEVTYKVTSTGGAIGSLEYYLIDGLNGAVTLPDTVGATSWTKQVDGGSGAHVSGKAPENGTATCTITGVATGKVLSTDTASPGRKYSCNIDK